MDRIDYGKQAAEDDAAFAETLRQRPRQPCTPDSRTHTIIRDAHDRQQAALLAADLDYLAHRDDPDRECSFHNQPTPCHICDIVDARYHHA